MQKLWLKAIHFKILKALEAPVGRVQLAEEVVYASGYVSSSVNELCAHGYLSKTDTPGVFRRTEKGIAAAQGEYVTMRELLVLSHLMQHKGTGTARSMISALLLDNSALGSVLRGLEKKEYVFRGARENGSRCWHLTPAGEVVVRANTL